MHNDILYLVIPAYNEADNIEQLIANWYPIVEAHDGGGASRMVVIDDGSRDDTYTLLRKLAADRPLLEPHTKKNGGHGPTLLYGYRHAIESGADWIFQTDSDGQTDPAEFEAFWALRERYDAILGDRAAREDGRSRVFVEKTLLAILRATFGVKIPDANAPFRLMRSDLVAKYIQKMPDEYNLPNVMLATYFSYFGEKLAFRTITFRPRQGGSNSINLKKITKIGWKALADFRALRRHIDDPDPPGSMTGR